MKRRITISIDDDLIRRIDKTRGDISRSRFVENILKRSVRS